MKLQNCCVEKNGRIIVSLPNTKEKIEKFKCGECEHFKDCILISRFLIEEES